MDILGGFKMPMDDFLKKNEETRESNQLILRNNL